MVEQQITKVLVHNVAIVLGVVWIGVNFWGRGSFHYTEECYIVALPHVNQPGGRGCTIVLQIQMKKNPRLYRFIRG